MKKAKIISIVIIMLSVIALGIFMGKQVFRLMEANNTDSAQKSDIKTESQVLHPLPNDRHEATASNFAVKPGFQTVEPVKETAKFEVSAPEKLPQPTIAPTSANSSVVSVASPTSVSATSNNTAEASQAKTELIVNSGLKLKPVTEKDTLPALSVKSYAFANGSGINVRSGPSIRDKMLFKVGKGTRGTVIERKNGWTHIAWDFNKQNGWVRDDLLNITSVPVMKLNPESSADKSKTILPVKEVSPENILAVALAKPADITETTGTYKEGTQLPGEAVINAETFANIRSLPTTSGEKIAKLPKGMVVKVKSVKKEGRWQWFEIVFQAGRKVGWTREDNLRFQ